MFKECSSLLYPFFGYRLHCSCPRLLFPRSSRARKTPVSMSGLLNAWWTCKFVGLWGVPGRASDAAENTFPGPTSSDLSIFSEHEVVQRLNATQRELGHVLGPFVNLADRRVAAFDAPMRVDSSFHVSGCLDVIALINLAPNMALQGGGSVVTYVFLSLGLKS